MITDKQQLIIGNLVKRFSKDRLKATDDIFYSMGNGSKLRNAPVKGNKVSAEEAFFLFTDKGIPTAKEDIEGWEQFKSYVIALRLLAITVGQWKDEWATMSTVERASFCKEIEDDGFELPSFMKDVWRDSIVNNTDVCKLLIEA